MINEDLTVSINEIFYSIQGEAKNSGKPTIFIRTAGCPFRCSYCDTDMHLQKVINLKLVKLFLRLNLIKLIMYSYWR